MRRLVFGACLMAACATSSTQDENRESVTATQEVKMSLDLQGHRGARGLLPESTLPSFERALDLQVSTLELDLHLSSDGQLIIWHDPFLRPQLCRTVEESVPDPDTLEPDDPALAIANLSVSELRMYICDRNPDPERFPEQSRQPTLIAGDDFRIVTLQELFRFVEEYAAHPDKSVAQRANAAALRYNIETKRVPDHPEYIGDDFDGQTPALFERELVRVLQEHGLVERAILQSFDHRSLWAARTLEPDLTLAVLDGLQHRRVGPLQEFRDKGAKIWSPRYTLVDESSIREAKKAGLLVVPWTVNDLPEMLRLVDLGVDGIISDRPDLFEELQERVAARGD